MKDFDAAVGEKGEVQQQLLDVLCPDREKCIIKDDGGFVPVPCD